MEAFLKKLLDYCEEHVDVDLINKKIEKQKQCLSFQNVDTPCVRISYNHPDFPYFSVEEIHQDMAKMMYNEIVSCLPQIETNDGGIPMIRANYGVGILPSVFGAKCLIINGNMPWCEHLTKDELKKLISAGIPSPENGFGKRVKETYAFYKEMLSQYPKCNQAIKFYHPDYQGPFDIAHLLFGSDIYMEIYDDPDFIHELLEFVCDTYINCMNDIKPYLNDEIDGFVYHWHHLYPGKVVLRDDSAVNLSPGMYEEFVKPYNDKILKAFGCGSMHFCGRADHWVFDMARDENIKAYNVGYMGNLVFGQEYLDFIKPGYYDNKKPVIGYVLSRNDIVNFDFKKYITGMTYNVSASNMFDAEEVIKKIEGSVK